MQMTPAGLPTRRFTVAHESQQPEAGLARRVECRMRVVAMGAAAQAASALKEGDAVVIEGFLAKASYRSEWPVLHAAQLKVI